MDPTNLNFEALGTSGLIAALLLYWLHMERKEKQQLKEERDSERERTDEAWQHVRNLTELYRGSAQEITVAMEKLAAVVGVSRGDSE